MRIVSLILALMSLTPAFAQEKNAEDPQKKIPTTLAEAHAELERTLPAKTLAEIDAMESEDRMALYHHGLGTALRNSWGLWGRSALAEHMRELGFTHPDDMSGVILGTFWCNRHGQEFRLEERAAKYRTYWKAAEERRMRYEMRQALTRDKMVPLRYETRKVPWVRIHIPGRGLNTRFACPFRNGVFLSVYMQGRDIDILRRISSEGISRVDPNTHEPHMRPEYGDAVRRGYYYDREDKKLHKLKPGDDFYTVPYFFDPADHKLHRVNVPEVNDVCACVVAGGRSWLAGMTNGEAVMVGIGEKDRITVPMPETDEIPDLGLDGDSLLAVYCKTIYRLDGRQWTLVHSGDILLPRSGPPPRRYGNVVYFRDEGEGESHKGLWWLTMGEKLHLSTLKRDADRAGVDGSSLWEVYSYYVTDTDDLWVCACKGTLLRHSKAGEYSFPILEGSILPAENEAGLEATMSGPSITSVTALPDGTLHLVGERGLYRLKGNELVQELGFALEGSARSWRPTSVLALDDRSYFIASSMWNGTYLLEKDNTNQWSARLLELGDAVVW